MSLLLAIWASGVIASAAGGEAAPDQPPGWDLQGTAQYLDDRLDLWFARASKVRTGAGETTCASCHAGLPYLLARPGLRQAMRVSQPTPQEGKLLDEIIQRVQTYGRQAPLSGNKEAQSRGTEAVLNALLLATHDARERRPQPSEVTRQAFQQLWDTQQPDGAWDWLDYANEPTESADARYYGAALAALAVGTVPGYTDDHQQAAAAQVQKLRAYLTGNFASQNLHHKAWLLLASTRLKGLLTVPQRQELVAELQARQNADGGWSLYRLGPWRWSKTAPPFAPGEKLDIASLEQSDGYATGLLVYVLRQTGMPADSPLVKKATAWLKANQRESKSGQQPWKYWSAPSLNHAREPSAAGAEPWRSMIPSDVATAFAVLALAPPE